MPDSQPSVLALDFGAQRVGVAVASLAARLPSPAGAIEQSPTFFDDIRTQVDAHNARVLVVGLPRSLDGNDTSQTLDARHFSQELAARLNLPVYLQDEALTSQQAEEELKSRKAGYNKGDVDALAATYILEDFLRGHPEVK